MKKRVPWYVAVLAVLIVIGVSAFVYSSLPIVPTVPPQPKGSNRPPAGLRANKNALAKAAEAKQHPQNVSGGKKPTSGTSRKPDATAESKTPTTG